MVYKYSFSQFLAEVHARDYHGTDDDMPDAFDTWLSNLDIDTIIALADEFGQRCAEASMSEA